MKPTAYILSIDRTYRAFNDFFNCFSIFRSKFPANLAITPSLVVFCGGNDINPRLYNKPNTHSWGIDDERDKWEVAWFNYCVENNIPMAGICRGMQLFTALTGGELVQHINGHTDDHIVIDLKSKKDIAVNSCHHQACILPRSAELLAVSPDSIAEAAWFPNVKALGVQYHPEWLPKHHEGYIYFKKLMETYINASTAVRKRE